jgi:DNA-binding NarL/FixJ family response regulator
MLVRGGHIGGTGLGVMLREHPWLRLAADVPAGPRAVDAARHGEPAVILVDTDGIDAPAIALVRELHESAEEASIIVLSDDVGTEALADLACIPVQGVLAWKDAKPEILEASVALAQAGVGVVSQTCLARTVARAGSKAIRGRALSRREHAVLVALLDGEKEHSIAKKLGIAERTVHDIVARLKEKLGASNLVQLGAYGASVRGANGS